MQFSITHQERYSRGQLLLRTLFGMFYIALPHGFLLFFASIWAMILGFLAFWAVLFTGKYPQSWFDYQVKLLAWSNRLMASMYNFTDEYPAFGTKGTSQSVSLTVPYPEKSSRGLLLLRMFFGIFYIWIPHGFCLVFRVYGMMFLMFLAWFAILFTGKYPKRFFDFNVGTLRWMNNLSLYTGLMTDEYPKFTGKE
ncbi:MAG: DUF4389 domain-containing protein [Spirochaetes bacterium]|nr:DUF4389 domain-containing protein [Spirochaetota bacterium]